VARNFGPRPFRSCLRRRPVLPGRHQNADLKPTPPLLQYGDNGAQGQTGFPDGPATGRPDAPHLCDDAWRRATPRKPGRYRSSTLGRE
jgi:hypothetical protein